MFKKKLSESDAPRVPILSGKLKKSVVKVVVFAVLAGASVFYALDRITADEMKSHVMKGRDTMLQTRTAQQSTPSRPPIDEYVPSRVETATFALG